MGIKLGFIYANVTYNMGVTIYSVAKFSTIMGLRRANILLYSFNYKYSTLYLVMYIGGFYF